MFTPLRFTAILAKIINHEDIDNLILLQYTPRHYGSSVVRPVHVYIVPSLCSYSIILMQHHVLTNMLANIFS